MSEDLFIRTERQQRFVDMAAGLADRFAERAPQHDRENTFPTQNYEDLRQAGYHRLTLPAEWGGEGASLVEAILAQERLARGDGATALSIGWHLAQLGKLVDGQTWPQPALNDLYREIGRGALINSIVSEVATGSPTRGGRPTTTARRTSTGWVLNGRKNFASMAPAIDYAVVSAGIADEEGAGWFVVPMGKSGVSILETWDSMGMRGTGSHDVLFTDVALPADAFVEPLGGPGPKGPNPIAGWALLIPAVYLGIARAARDFALNYAANRRTNALSGSIAELPHIQALLGQIEADLFTARAALYSVANLWESAPESRAILLPQLGTAKLVAVGNALQIVDKAMRVVGAAGLSRALPLERLYRDVRAGLHNPPMDDATLSGLAKAALQSIAAVAAPTPALTLSRPVDHSC